jgi:hypothetical protein
MNPAFCRITSRVTGGARAGDDADRRRVHTGGLKQVRLVTEPDPELDARHREALAHRDAGALAVARRVLDPLN